MNQITQEDLVNGSPVTLTFPEAGEVFTAAPATTGLKFKIGRKEPIIIGSEGIGGEEVDAWLLEVSENSADVWMVYSPEVNKQIVGMIWGGKDSIYIKNLTNMQNDIANLRDKISLYYLEYGEIPVKTEYTNINNYRI